uniref:Ovule protein n=1 Tax=Panagrellus redivivus TaxID=6233 RepID=A0A7E4W692_PANRE
MFVIASYNHEQKTEKGSLTHSLATNLTSFSATGTPVGYRRNILLKAAEVAVLPLSLQAYRCAKTHISLE